MFQRSNTAVERALSLDPDLELAAATLIVNHTESGDLTKAYPAAVDLVRRRPQGAQAHFALSYVTRYAGDLERSAHECEAAVSLDPGNYQFRSCAFTFMLLGKTDRALDFFKLDAGSEWTQFNLPDAFVRAGDRQKALEAAKLMGTDRFERPLYIACLDPGSAKDLDQEARQMEKMILQISDPEVSYTFGSFLASCGQNGGAMRLLKSAIQRGYCSVSALQTDPMLAKLRGTPEFSQLVSAGKECQERFRAGISQASH